MATKLIPCAACGDEIATSARSCPKCGAENTWLHPVVKSFLTKPARYDSPEHEFRYNSTQISGWCEKAKTRSSFKLMHIGLAVCLFSLIVILISPGLASFLLLIGVGLTIFGQLRQGPGLDFQHEFRADFSNDSFQWWCDDNAFWEPVRKQLEHFYRHSKDDEGSLQE